VRLQAVKFAALIGVSGLIEQDEEDAAESAAAASIVREHPAGGVEAARLIDQCLRALDADQLDDAADAFDGNGVALTELTGNCKV
jgi:hypothetical protein